MRSLRLSGGLVDMAGRPGVKGSFYRVIWESRTVGACRRRSSFLNSSTLGFCECATRGALRKSAEHLINMGCRRASRCLARHVGQHAPLAFFSKSAARRQSLAKSPGKLPYRVVRRREWFADGSGLPTGVVCRREWFAECRLTNSSPIAQRGARRPARRRRPLRRPRPAPPRCRYRAHRPSAGRARAARLGPAPRWQC
jgi:hypothetical protein